MTEKATIGQDWFDVTIELHRFRTETDGTGRHQSREDHAAEKERVGSVNQVIIDLDGIGFHHDSHATEATFSVGQVFRN